MFTLTDAGRAAVAERPAGAPAPWDELSGAVDDDVAGLATEIRGVADGGRPDRPRRQARAGRGRAEDPRRRAPRALPAPRRGRARRRAPGDRAERRRRLRARPREALRRRRGRRGIDFDVAPARRSASSARTAPASRPRSTCSAPSQPTGGSAQVAGLDVVRERTTCGATSASSSRTRRSTTTSRRSENLRFHAELYGVPAPTSPPRIDEVLEMVGLWTAASGLGQDLLGRDEAPPRDRARAAALARGALPRRADRRPRPADAQPHLGLHRRAAPREDITIFLTTHYMDEAEHCDRIAIIDNGEIVVMDTPEALKAGVGERPRRARAPTTTPRRSRRSRERFDLEAT